MNNKQFIYYSRLCKLGTKQHIFITLHEVAEAMFTSMRHSRTLLKEMVHVVGRAHATKLRAIAFGLGFVLPLAILIAPFSHALAAVAVLSHIAGILASRWLFFAEAEHVVGLYYGKR